MPDEEFEAVMWVCLHKGEGCPELDDVVEFVEEEFNIEIEDEVLDTVYTCAENIVRQLGFGHLLDDSKMLLQLLFHKE